MTPPNPWRKDDSLTKLLIFGAGGFGREVAWLARQSLGDEAPIGFVIDDASAAPEIVNGVPVTSLDAVGRQDGRFVVAIGDPGARRKIVGRLKGMGFDETTIIHPRVEMSQFVSIAPGSILCAGVIATVNIEIGQHVHVNLDCTIGHDVKIGDFTTVSPGVHISGNVTIGEGVFLGTGASIINGGADAPLMIGDNAVIAAGACVTRPVEAGAMVAGVPAVRKR